MGAFTDLFKKNSTDHSPSTSSTSPSRQPHSTLDLDLPSPSKPLWALATEPDLSRRNFGPRDPWEKRDENARNRSNPQNREGRGNGDRVILQESGINNRVHSMQELRAGMDGLRLNGTTQARTNLSQPHSFSNPPRPSRPPHISPSRSTPSIHFSPPVPSTTRPAYQPRETYPPHPPSRNPVLVPNPYSNISHNAYPSNSTTPFPSYPPYPPPPAYLSNPTQQLYKPLPSPSHSPDRPRPQPRPISASHSSQSLTATAHSSSPLKPPSRSPSPPKPSQKSTTSRKKPPPACIELSSSTESSAEYSTSDADSDSSIEFVNTSSSSRTSPSSFKTSDSTSPVRSKVKGNRERRSSSPVKKGKNPIAPRNSSSKPSSPIKKPTPASSTTPSKTPPTTSSTPRRRRANHSSCSSAANSPVKKLQCHGLTSSGKRCTRFTTPSTPLIQRDSEGEEGDEGEGEAKEEPSYCHQHTKLSLVETGCYVISRVPEVGNDAILGDMLGKGSVKGNRKREIWVNYSDWILPDLPLATQSLLRYYMAEPVSEKDRTGYIYIHELVDKNSPPSSTTPSSRTYLKLGRTIHPILRLSQWRSSCPSLDPIVRDILPRSQPSSSPHRKRFAEEGTENCHRWERLCLVEIAGRLELEGEKESREKCKDCGKKHLECFRVGREAFSELGGVGEGGWVVEIVERWERWCRDVLG
ncbi:hypothetical protein JCM5353_000056 [Sporobolomyces roseus]